MESLTAMSERVGALLKEKGHTVAVVESSAGGLISAALLAVPGASKFFLGGGVIYTAQARGALLGVTNDDIPGIRSSSEPYAQVLARAAQAKLGTTWGIGETGAAGPTGNRYGDQPGHTCIAVAGPAETVTTLETGLDDREENMWRFTKAALELFEQMLGKAG